MIRYLRRVLGCRGSLDAADGVADDVDHEVGVGQHGDVAAVDVVGGGVHALGAEALQLGVDGVVVVGDDVPARLGLPGDAVGFGAEQLGGGRGGGGPDDLLLGLGQVPAEVRGGVVGHPDAPVGDLDVAEQGRLGK